MSYGVRNEPDNRIISIAIKYLFIRSDIIMPFKLNLTETPLPLALALNLKSKILFSIFNFMNHIISSKNTLVYDIYIKSRETNPWVKNVKKTY